MWFRTLTLLPTLFSLFSLSSCNRNEEPVNQTRVVNLQGQFISVLETNCYSCHGPNGTGEADFNFANNIDGMISVGYIVVGDSASSPLYQRMTATDSTLMPPSGQVSQASLDIVKEYIDTLDGN